MMCLKARFSSSTFCAKLTLFNGDAMLGLMGCGEEIFGFKTCCSGEGRPMLSDDRCACCGFNDTADIGGFANWKDAGELGLEEPLEAIELMDAFDAC